MYDIAIHEAGLGEELFSGGDVAKVAANMSRLVGHLMPVFSQVRPPSTAVTKVRGRASRYVCQVLHGWWRPRPT